MRLKLELESLKPIYLQIAEGIEDDILNEILSEDEQAYSQYQIAREFNINPATAAKGINVLVAEGMLYKKRGLGMYVSKGAKKMILEKRRTSVFNSLIREIMQEAKKLNISKAEIIKMIDNFSEEAEL